MKKCIVIPDSFKGTMSAIEVCDIMASCIRTVFPDCQIHEKPIADGGEGTVDCFLRAIGGRRVHVPVNNPFFEPLDAFYGRIGNTAIVEMAAAAGLMLCRGRPDPMTTSTFGVGELIRHAVETGCTEIILGLGGSCTNDAGAGMAAALGTRFTDAAGREIIPAGGTLGQVVTVDNSRTRALLKGIRVRAMCDIENPMYGPEGAAYIFGPQKGAGPDLLPILDENLRLFADLVEKELQICVHTLPGGGAAGAMGAGAAAFLQATLERGIDVVLDLLGFEQLLSGCDRIFTGEGRFDRQSLGGKAVIGISRRAAAADVPVTVIAGSVEKGLGDLAVFGITSVYATSEKPMSSAELRKNCEKNLERAMFRALQDLCYA